MKPADWHAAVDAHLEAIRVKQSTVVTASRYVREAQS
jgi:hypothetical protein